MTDMITKLNTAIAVLNDAKESLLRNPKGGDVCKQRGFPGERFPADCGGSATAESGESGAETMIAFYIGCVVGAVIGFFICALIVKGWEGDE